MPYKTKTDRRKGLWDMIRSYAHHHKTFTPEKVFKSLSATPGDQPLTLDRVRQNCVQLARVGDLKVVRTGTRGTKAIQTIYSAKPTIQRVNGE